MPTSGQGREAGRGRRLGGWGFEGEAFLPSAELLAWLGRRLGEPAGPFPSFDPERFRPAPARPLPEDLAGSGSGAAVPCSTDPLDRLAHARGQGLPDLLRLRGGAVPALPDAVLRPGDDDEVERVLRAAAREGVRVIPWGGGTSVTGGVNVLPGDAPVVSLDLGRLSGLEAFDETSGLATLGAGTPGPALEAALRRSGGGRGFTLGHFPQSWELSTLGGWAATRASGQESLGYGGIQELVAGLALVAPAGRLELPAFPASAAGPDLRHLVVGSEGRLGVITRATVRVRPVPERIRVAGTLLPGWDAGLAGARGLVQEGVPLTLLRLSDEPETEVALAVGLGGRGGLVAPLVRAYLRLRGVRGSGCLLLAGAAGAPGGVDQTLEWTAAVLRRHGGVSLGERPGRHWLADRFRHPYLRDALLDRGIATDTLETAAPWSRLPALAAGVRRALEEALAGGGERAAVLCHVSHPYRDGASLYFTLFFRCPADPEAAIARWAAAKRAATGAIVRGGGTLSHHHGVGSWHAPWYEDEVGARGRALVAAAAAAMDPAGVLNPHVLLDPADRLEA
jgi:alkyldihydroxyacetonephosphate synthase